MSSQTQVSPSPRSGEQFEISARGYTATIAAVGAALRTLQYMGRDLIVSFDADEVRPQSRGALLAPWPNRVADGRYTFGGKSYQLPLTEPARRNAIHGLVGWQAFTPVEVAADRVCVEADITPQSGYPFQVRVTVEFVLDERGLTQTVTGTNLGREAAPWGVGFHPYLVADGTEVGRAQLSPVDSWTLSLPAAQMLRASDDRLLPLGVEPISEHAEFDFRTPRPVGPTRFDHAFTGLGDADGYTTVELTTSSVAEAVGTGTGDAEGTGDTAGVMGVLGVGMTWGPDLPWVQVYSSDGVAGTPTHRHGLAVEPMTCPADAFNSGTNLVALQPGGAHTVNWRIYAISA